MFKGLQTLAQKWTTFQTAMFKSSSNSTNKLLFRNADNKTARKRKYCLWKNSKWIWMQNHFRPNEHYQKPRTWRIGSWIVLNILAQNKQTCSLNSINHSFQTGHLKQSKVYSFSYLNLETTWNHLQNRDH